MTNVADLVNAVNVKKEKEFELFDKVDFICRTLGTKYPGEVDTYIYEGDNLRFVLNEGVLINKDSFKDVIVQTLDKEFFFNYFKNLSTDVGNTNLYIQGDWEKRVNTHYRMALYNTR